MLRICKLDAVVFSDVSKYNEITKQIGGFHDDDLRIMSPGTVLGDNLSYPNAKKLSMRTVPTDMYRARGQNRGILLL